MRSALTILALWLWAMHGEASAESVTFPGAGLTEEAELFRPEGAGPFPAVIALHGCAGFRKKDGTLGARDADWVARLTAAGFLVLFPDSFGSRGAGAQCKVRERTIMAYRERVEDSFAALSYLQSRADVKRDAISLLGWSNGAGTVLYLLRNAAASGDSKGFAKAIAFYPGCRRLVERGNWRTEVPLLILIGEADDWTPAAPCRALVDAARGSGQPVSIVTYPGAYHDFDHPDLKLRRRTGLTYTPDGSGVAHIGADPAAREDARKRVLEFLAR
jgi:dienelactone hydrolase